MTKCVLVIALVFASACGGGDKAKLQAMKKAMCACKDKACTQRVEKENELWLKAFAEKFPKGEHGREIPEDLLAIVVESDKCMSAARDAEYRAEFERTMLHPELRPASEAATKFIAVATTTRDQMCACKDKACADKVDADSSKLTEAILKEKPDLDGSEAQDKQIEELGQAISDCRDRVSK